MPKEAPVPALARYNWAMVAIVLLAVVVRLPGLGTQSIAFDESFSLVVALADWTTLFQAILSDGVHPPLFYMIHKGVLGLWGTTEFGQRFSAALFSLICLPLLYWSGRSMFNQRVGLLGALLLALNPLHVWFAQEARMYSLLSALALISITVFWQAMRTHRRRYWIALTVVNSIIFAVHYFGFLIPISQFLFIVLTFRHNYRQLRLWVLTQFIAFLPLVPWLVATARRETQSFGIGFLQRPILVDLPLTWWNFAIGLSDNFYWPISMLALILFVVAGFNGLHWHEEKYHPGQLILIIWIFLLPILVWLMSQRRSFYSDRYLSFVIPGLILLVAFGSTRLKSSVWRGLLAAGLIVASGYGLVNSRSDPAFFKDNWREAVAYLARYEQAGDVILLYNSHLDIPFGYYYQGQLPHKPISRVLDRFAIAPLVAGYRRAWVVYHYGRHPTHYPWQPLRPNGHWAEDLDRNPLLAEWLDAQAGHVVDYQHFRGLELWLVECQ
jgi:mannosyltransferase